MKTETQVNKKRVIPISFSSYTALISQYAPITAKNKWTRYKPRLWLPFNLLIKFVWASKIPIVERIKMDGILVNVFAKISEI